MNSVAMELLDAIAGPDAWGSRVGSSSPLMTAAEHDALASFLISVETLDLQLDEDGDHDARQDKPSKRKRSSALDQCCATGVERFDCAAIDMRESKKKKKIPTHQRRKCEMAQLTQTLKDLQTHYRQILSARWLQAQQTRTASRALIEHAEREVIQSTATNMHLRRSVQRAQARANTLDRLLSQMASPSPIPTIRSQQRLPERFHHSDTDIFEILEHRLGSKALEIHQRLLEGEFQWPEATCDLNDACVNGSVVDFSSVRILPFNIEMINDITWRCYDELEYAPGMIQLLAERCGDVMTLKQVFLIERNAEPDILLVLRAVCKRFKRNDDYIVTWEGVIDGSLQIDGDRDEVFLTQTRESGWGIARPMEHANDSATILQSFIQVTPSTQKRSEPSDSLITKMIPTYSWVVDKRYQEMENRLLDAVVQGTTTKSLVICEVP